jgi:hypothetical protein
MFDLMLLLKMLMTPRQRSSDPQQLVLSSLPLLLLSPLQLLLWLE